MDQQEAITVTTDLDPEVLAIAERQALDDAALMEALQVRTKERKRAAVGEAILLDVKTAEDAQPTMPARPPMNRAERRAQVKFYAKVLAETERQQPYVNPTIKPRATRRQRKHARSRA